MGKGVEVMGVGVGDMGVAGNFGDISVTNITAYWNLG